MHWVHGDANLSDALTKGGAEGVMLDFFRRKQQWTLIHDPDMRSAKKRKADKADRLDATVQVHAASTESWNYEWPQPAPTLAQDAQECDTEYEEPFGYLDSGALRCLLKEWLLDRSRDTSAYCILTFGALQLDNDY